jgi:DNA processing protein
VATAGQPARTADPAPTGAPGRLLGALGYDPVGLDALMGRTGIGAAELQALLLELELSGHVARLPGGLFQRIAAV